MTSTVTHTTRPDRVAVFIDYGNAHRCALTTFHPFGAPTSDGQLDPVALAQLLTLRRNRPSELTQVRIYRGEPSDHRQPGAAIANRRQCARWRRDPRVQVHSRPLAYSPNPDRPPQEKGIDVSLAIDLAMADGHAFDVAIVFSCDRDVLPGIETARRRRAVHVEVAAWTGTARLYLPDGARLWCHHLAEPDYLAVTDRRRYLDT